MSSPRRTLLAVLLAAGAGRRFSGPTHKLLAPLRGAPLVSHALSAMRNADIGDSAVITGSTDLSGLLDGLTELHNPHWESGQHSSVATAVRFAQEHGYEALVIGLGDQPFVTSEAWKAVAETEGDIVVATYDGKRGNPVKLSRSVWDEFLSLTKDPDAGARTLMHIRPELVREVACNGVSADIDTPEDLAQWT
ncbi:MAG: nucleotidyltransferase family protein [Ilumatobacteraceae bacterium]